MPADWRIEGVVLDELGEHRWTEVYTGGGIGPNSLYVWSPNHKEFNKIKCKKRKMILSKRTRTEYIRIHLYVHFLLIFLYVLAILTWEISIIFYIYFPNSSKGK